MSSRWLPIPFGVEGLARLLPYYRGNWSVRASWRARRALDRVLARGPLDALVFHTQCTALFSVDRMRRIPALISLDATPLNYRPGEHAGRLRSPRRRRGVPGPAEVPDQPTGFPGRLGAGAVVCLGQALVDRRLRRRSRPIRVLAPGAAADFFALGRRRLELRAGSRSGWPGSAAGLLFVGGDWTRKGGPQLLGGAGRTDRSAPGGWTW